MRCESARPACGWSREHERGAERVDASCAASGSGHRPLTRRRSSERKRVSRKKRPCGKPGQHVARGQRDRERGPSTSVTIPPSQRRRTRGRSSTAAALHAIWPSRRIGRDRCSVVRIAEIAPPWFAVPPSGYGGIELVVSLLTDGSRRARPRRHAVRERRLADQGDPRHPAVDPPDPALLGNVWFDVCHALTAYLDADDRSTSIHDHSRNRRPRARGAAPRAPAGRPHAARPVDRTRRGATTRCSRATISPRRDQRLAAR